MTYVLISILVCYIGFLSLYRIFKGNIPQKHANALAMIYVALVAISIYFNN